MDFAICLALACQPQELPQVLDWMRCTGRRGWVQRLEVRRGCDRRDWCNGGDR
ncbi:hypothetical protein H6G51_18225 [Limnothrix sp. FACHB-708]|uniref:hypothetical protein n=1 Tax=unclassified Limnothrix TaxID=2632864 RepID=UPI0016844BEA|nr:MULTISPECIES: hypothetical protein [unclassified Limnothrix]MBD2555226.1 hypothetical protein [Limnothrix sp. FACHB-708]MBD2592643.1 hypothetical protein [Limnothrix sp. FACHB-406]